MGKRKLTDGQIARMREMRSGGLSYETIGDAVGLSGSGVRLYLCPKARAYKIACALDHKEEAHTYNVAYYVAHRKGILRRVAEYQVGREEEKRFYNATYAIAHKGKIQAQKEVYRATHKEEAHRWRQDHASELNARNATRKAFVLGATIGNLAEIAWIYRRAKEDPKVRCYLCGKLIPKGHRHVDHITPVSKGGAHRPLNLAVACDECNLSKKAKLPEEVGVLL